jgi:hypothetical protein
MAYPPPPSYWESDDSAADAVPPPPLSCLAGAPFRVFGANQSLRLRSTTSAAASSLASDWTTTSDWTRIARFAEPRQFALAVLSRKCHRVVRVAQVQPFLRALNAALRRKVAELFRQLSAAPAECDTTLSEVHAMIASMQRAVAGFRPHEAREALIESREAQLARVETLEAWVRAQVAAARAAADAARREEEGSSGDR